LKLHVGNLPKDFSDEQLNDIAKPFGTVNSAEIVKDRISGGSKGFGFLVYESADEATAAIAGLNGKDVSGQAIKVSEARSPKDREVRKA
jgi:RNA recognition motif-containing protein